jgi:hypothetical protein
MSMVKRVLLILLGLAWTSQTLAATDNMQSSPTEPLNQGMRLHYESAFSNYKPYIEEDISSWRELNEKVRGGGHAGHSMDGMKQDESSDEMKSKPAESKDHRSGSEHHHME